jgi:hypothetical protein
MGSVGLKSEKMTSQHVLRVVRHLQPGGLDVPSLQGLVHPSGKVNTIGGKLGVDLAHLKAVRLVRWEEQVRPPVPLVSFKHGNYISFTAPI